ncbi:MAG TPA: PAS domain S-box protein [Candidatus Omnitrophota bacterium]|nr:PAS domain S-box protein [Candidatus Omnitrophota bacterium]
MPTGWQWGILSSLLFLGVSAGSVFLFLNRHTRQRKKNREPFKGEIAYEAILRTAMDGFCLLDEAGRFLDANESYCRLLGYSLEELNGLSLEDVEASKNPAEIDRHLQSIVRTTGYDRFMTRNWRKDGQAVDLEISVNYLKSERQFFSFVRDVTNRKQMETALQENEEKFRKIASSAQDAIIMIDQHGKISFWNESAEKMFRYSRDEVLGRELHRFLAPERYRGTYEKAFGRFAETGEGLVLGKTLTLEALRKDGTEFPIELSVSPVRIGGHWNAIGIVRDVTDRKRVAEEMLRLNRESEERIRNFRTLVANIPGAVYRCAPDSARTMDFLSEAIASISGYPASELIENRIRSYSSIVHPDDRALMEQAISEGAKQGKPYAMEYRIIHSDGSIRWVYEQGQGCFGEDAKLLSFDGAIFDISENKRIEENLSKLNQCFLSFSPNPDENIKRLVVFLGEISGASCALYNRLEGKELHTFAEWNAPADLVRRDVAEGHICYDVIRHQSQKGAFLIRNLPETDYAKTDPNVMRYGLKTYFGKTVEFRGNPLGTLCLVSLQDFFPDAGLEKLMGIVAQAIGIEEARKRSEDEIKILMQRMEFILGAAKTGLDIIDSEFNLVYVDPEWAKLYGDPKGKKCYEYFMDRAAVCPGCGIPEALKTKKVVVTEEILAREGNRPILVTTIPFQDARGNWLVAEVNVDISERKRAEAALKQSEEKYRELVENADTIILRVDPEGRITFFNEFAQKFFGYREEEILGRHVVGTIVPEEDSFGRDLKGMVRDVLNRPSDYQTNETENVIRSGERVWIYWANKPVYDAKGNLKEILCVGSDITELKETEGKLKAAHRFLDSIVENIPNMIFVKDAKDLRFVRFNRAGEELLGHSREELLGKNDYDFFEKKEADFFTGKDRQVLSEGKLLDIPEEPIDTKYKGRRFLHTKKIPIPDEWGEPLYLLGISEDITEKKTAEEKLRRSEEHFRSLIENALDVIILLDRDGNVKYASPSIGKILGYPPEELVGKNAFNYVHPDDLGKVRGIFEKGARIPGHIDTAELRFRAKNGEWRVCESIGENLLQDPAVAGIVINSRDVTERKQQQEILLEKTAELIKANAEKEQLELFAVLASHDLREPLQKIMGLVDLLKDHVGGTMDPSGMGYLEKVENAVGRLNRLIGDLLQFSKVTIGTKPLEEVDLNLVLYHVLADLELHIDRSGGKVEVGELPKIRADKLQMRQLFQNLISNGLKFCRKDVSPLVRVSSRPLENDRVEITVEDNGIGFDGKYAERIFKPFERLHSRSEYEGSGLGLPICHKIVARHRGTIEAESVQGRGSVFRVILPVGK